MFEDVERIPEWHKEASCSNHPDPDLWWYQSYRHEDEQQLQILRMAEALSICNDCPVRELCLNDGLKDENIIPGSIWGGMLNYERRVLRNKRRAATFRSETRMVRKVRRLVPVKTL